MKHLLYFLIFVFLSSFALATGTIEQGVTFEFQYTNVTYNISNNITINNISINDARTCLNINGSEWCNTSSTPITINIFSISSIVITTLTNAQAAAGISNVQTVTYAALGLVALIIMVGFAVLFINLIGDGADLTTVTLMVVSAIGVTIVIFIGYIIISTVGSSLT